MSDLQVGDIVAIRDDVEYTAFRGFPGKVLKIDPEYRGGRSETRGGAYLEPLQDRPDTKDRYKFWWNSAELRVVNPDPLSRAIEERQERVREINDELERTAALRSERDHIHRQIDALTTARAILGLQA